MRYVGRGGGWLDHGSLARHHDDSTRERREPSPDDHRCVRDTGLDASARAADDEKDSDRLDESRRRMKMPHDVLKRPGSTLTHDVPRDRWKRLWSRKKTWHR